MSVGVMEDYKLKLRDLRPLTSEKKEKQKNFSSVVNRGWLNVGDKEEKRGKSKNDEAPVVLRTLTIHSGEEVWPGERTSVRRADATAHF